MSCLDYTNRLKAINIAGLCLLIFTAFWGPAFLVFKVGSLHLFPFRIIWVILLLASIPYLYLNRAETMKELGRSRTYFIYLLIWFLYGVMSMIWAADKGGALRQVFFLAMGISIIFFVAIYFKSLSSLLKLQGLWILTLAPIVVIGFWNLFTGQHLPSSSHFGTGFTIPTSVFHYHNDLATYLALSLPFVLTYGLYSKKGFQKALAFILFISTLVLLITTGSRANVLAVAFGALFWFIFLARGRLRLQALALTLGLAFLFAAFILLSPTDLALLIRGSAHGGLEKIVSTFRILSGAEGDMGISFTSRLNFIRNGLVYLVDSYGFGVGAGNAEYYIENFQYYHTFGYTNIHNWWVEIAVNYGLIIFIGFLYYYFSLMFNLHKLGSISDSPRVRMISEATLISLVIFFFASMSSSSLFGYGFPWILFALATGLVSWHRNCEAEECL